MKNKAEGAQNVEVSKKLPCEKPLMEQLEIMEAYTAVHQRYTRDQKERRELECLKVLYPRLFRSIQEQDRIAGRLDFLPIGFGCVTSLGGVGHYCVFDKLRKFQAQLPKQEQARVDALYAYWTSQDVKAIYCDEVIDETTTGRFIDCSYPFMATARLSGMMLHYDWLCELGVQGLIDKIDQRRKREDTPFLRAASEALALFQDVIRYHITLCEAAKGTDSKRCGELDRMIASLRHIQTEAPSTFHQALQLIWLYALISGCINYGRMDDILGPYLVRDMQNGILTMEEAHDDLVSLWRLIEQRRTTVNGRIVVGGYGRKHPQEADVFARLALQVTRECKFVEPQFTLRFCRETPQDIMDLAYDSLGENATYPTLYNDDVNVAAVMDAMRISREDAEQYVPFGCGEYVIQGQSVGTPNTLLNLVKLLQISLHDGYDPEDGIRKADGVLSIDQLKTFEDLYANYKHVLDEYFDKSIRAQYRSYEIMNEEVSFLFVSILMEDCVERGKALLDGGVKYLGGTNETYGNINASDSLRVLDELVYRQKKYRLRDMNEAIADDFVGHDEMLRDIRRVVKYGNDDEQADAMAVRLYEDVAKGIRDRGIEWGMQYYLIVISNNQTNTEWGRQTAASYDGRRAHQFMNPANNPVGGANVSGPTAMLNSLVKLNPAYHGGSVQNIKFTPRMFNEKRSVIKSLFQTYFDRGGCHLMVTVIDRGVLEEAQKHPENYPHLIVRVSGFSAVFVNLDRDVQNEVMSRVLYDG